MATAVTTPPDHQSAPFSEAAGPCAMVLFGASGDLTKRRLAPALFNLAKVSLLPKNFAILGVAIEQLGDEQFRTQVSSFLPAEDRDTEAWDWFQQRLYYQCGDFADPGTYSTVACLRNSSMLSLPVPTRSSSFFGAETVSRAGRGTPCPGFRSW